MPKFLDMPLKDFIAQAASDAPVPGGGGAAALAGALGAAMAAMAANFTIGRPKYARHDALMRQILDELATLGRDLQDAVDADAEAFSAISEAYKLPKDGEGAAEKRQAAIQDALYAAMLVPLTVLRRSREAAELLPRLAETANINLLSDVEVAGYMLEAAARAARANILINSSRLTGDEARQAEAETERSVMRVATLASKTVDDIAKRRSAP